MRWMQRVRLKVLTITAILVATAVALVSVLALPAWGVWIGAAAAVALVVNTVASRLSSNVCLGCGHDLAHEARGEFGASAPSAARSMRPATSPTSAANAPKRCPTTHATMKRPRPERHEA